MVGLVFFGIGSCIIAVAGAQTALLAGRALQGLAAAVAVPSTLAAVDTSVASERRAAAIGAWTGFLMLGFSIGPLVGGTLTHFTGWRVIFWLNVPLMLTAIAGLACAGSATGLWFREQKSARGLDRLCPWLTTLIVSLVFGLHRIAACADGTAPGYRPLPTGGRGALSAAKGRGARGGAACRLELLRAPQLCDGPHPSARWRCFSIMSLLLYFNLYAQSREGLGLTALEAGLCLLPLSAALLALALSASAVAARVGLRNATRGGMALIAIASGIIGLAIADGGMVILAIGFFAMGAGLAVPYALAPRLALSALSRAQAGQGSGIVNACTFLGGSCGVAGGATALALGGISGRADIDCARRHSRHRPQLLDWQRRHRRGSLRRQSSGRRFDDQRPRDGSAPVDSGRQQLELGRAAEHVACPSAR